MMFSIFRQKKCMQFECQLIFLNMKKFTPARWLYSLLIKSKYGLCSFHMKIKMSNEVVDIQQKHEEKLEENLLNCETRTPSASRLATCEFHLWISYSTDNETLCMPHLSIVD